MARIQALAISSEGHLPLTATEFSSVVGQSHTLVDEFESIHQQFFTSADDTLVCTGLAVLIWGYSNYSLLQSEYFGLKQWTMKSLQGHTLVEEPVSIFGFGQEVVFRTRLVLAVDQ